MPAYAIGAPHAVNPARAVIQATRRGVPDPQAGVQRLRSHGLWLRTQLTLLVAGVTVWAAGAPHPRP